MSKSPNFPSLQDICLLSWQTHAHTQAYAVLPASAKSQQFSAEPLLFLIGTLIPEAALCGHLMAGPGIEQ